MITPERDLQTRSSGKSIRVSGFGPSHPGKVPGQLDELVNQLRASIRSLLHAPHKTPQDREPGSTGRRLAAQNEADGTHTRPDSRRVARDALAGRRGRSVRGFGETPQRGVARGEAIGVPSCAARDKTRSIMSKPMRNGDSDARLRWMRLLWAHHTNQNVVRRHEKAHRGGRSRQPAIAPAPRNAAVL